MLAGVARALAFVCVLSTITWAQEVSERSFVSSHWGLGDGRPQSSGRTMAQTRDGYLWLGTWNGLARFDGVRFTTFHSSHTRSDQTRRLHHEMDRSAHSTRGGPGPRRPVRLRSLDSVENDRW